MIHDGAAGRPVTASRGGVRMGRTWLIAGGQVTEAAGLLVIASGMAVRRRETLPPRR